MLLLAATMLRAQASAPEGPDHERRRVAWLSENAVRIRTVDPAKDDFADLEPLRETLKGVRVVLLGEQNHGDGTTFLAKTRLIRFLHEKMGFDMLAFESGLYDCAKAWDALARDRPGDNESGIIGQARLRIPANAGMEQTFRIEYVQRGSPR
jgi:erythromycin esterase-like protein